ncbi:hypothetical protein JCM5350_001223 [Sporobolomyces pararoseus]
MDSLSSWRNAGSGFDLSNVPARQRPHSSSSTASTSQQRSRKPTPSSSRAPNKQALLFSRDKTPLITPRDSTSKPNRSTQSKLSASSFGRRTPLVEKPSNRTSTASSSVGGGGSIRKKKQSLELVDVDVVITEASSDVRNRDSAQLSKSLSSLSKSLSSNSSTLPSTSKWKGKLSNNRQSPHPSTVGISHSSIARQILNPTKPRKGPTIEFDRDDVGSDSENEMKGESQRRKRRKVDWGGWGKLDLMNAEDAEEEERERAIERETSNNRYPSPEDQEGKDEKERSPKTRTSINKSQKQVQKSFVLNRLPPPRPPSRSQNRPTASTQSSSGSVTSSAEDIQARLVPFKPAPRVLVPDSDELAPVEYGEGLEEPDTEMEEEEEEEEEEEDQQPAEQQRHEKFKRPERSDDSGFVEMIDLSHSSSPRSRPPLRSTSPFDSDDNDDVESIPDSQPSVASHLSLPLGSSPPRSSSSVVILERLPQRRPPPLLKPTESAILMPPPPAIANPPRKRLRRGPPPRPNPPPTPSSSRVLVEDTQLFSPFSRRSPTTKSSTSESRPYRIFAEETQYGLNEEEEALTRWNELNTRLPSDLDGMRFDSDMSVRLPTPKPLRPSKELVVQDKNRLESPSLSRSVTTITPINRVEEGNEQEGTTNDISNLGARTSPKISVNVEGWQSLDQAWKGSLPLSPPPPPVPRQSRLTEHFSINPSIVAVAPGGEVVEDSQAPAGGYEVYELERAVRDSIRYLTRKEEGEGVSVAVGKDDVGKLEEEQEKEKEKEEEDEIESDCSSPLTELSPSPSPLPPHPELQLQEASADDVREEEGGEEELIPDSDPEDDFNSTSSNNRGKTLPISPLGGESIRSRFPRYELPKSVLDFGKEKTNAEMENPKQVGGEEEEEVGMVGEESMWESYWTLGSPTNEGDENEEVVGGANRSKTAAELLLEEAPEIDLPPGWSYNDQGELVKECYYEGLDGEL